MSGLVQSEPPAPVLLSLLLLMLPLSLLVLNVWSLACGELLSQNPSSGLLALYGEPGCGGLWRPVEWYIRTHITATRVDTNMHACEKSQPSHTLTAYLLLCLHR